MSHALLIAAIVIVSLAAALMLVRRARVAGVAVGVMGLAALLVAVGSLGGVPASPAPEELPEPDAWLAAVGPPRSFDPSTIHREINGAADLYLRNGLVGATFRTYRAGGVELTLELYDLGTESGASAVFAEQVAPDRPRTPALGDEGAADDMGADARAGRLYLRITHNEAEPEELAAPMTALARAALAAGGAPDSITGGPREQP